MLQSSPALTSKLLGRWLTKRKSQALKHCPEYEGLINTVFKNCVTLIFLLKNSRLARNKISFIQEFPLENKWMTFLDKLPTSTNHQNTQTILLFKILVQELISKEKVCRKFWTVAFKELSEKLLLPIKIDCQDSDSTSSSNSLKKEVVSSPFLKVVTHQNQLNKNSQKTCYQSYTSSTVEKWEKEVTPPKLKTLKIQLKPTTCQKGVLDEYLDTFRYVYNRTRDYVCNEKYDRNTIDLQNILVTEKTKINHPIYKFIKSQIKDVSYEMSDVKKQLDILKQEKQCIEKVKKSTISQLKKEKVIDYNKIINIITSNKQIKELQDKIQQYTKVLIELVNKSDILKSDLDESSKDIQFKKNQLIHDFELFTPKDIRDCAVSNFVDGYNVAEKNLENGNIKYFNMGYKKKGSPRQHFEITPKLIKVKDGKVRITPSRLKEKNEKIFSMSPRDTKKYKNLKINHNCDIVKEKGKYFLHVPIPTITTTKQDDTRICGVDPGLRSFATTFNGHDGSSVEYKHNQPLLDKLNEKIRLLKKKRTRILPFNYLKPKKIKKKQINKIEKKKIDFTNNLHWNVIHDLLDKNDIIYFGDIKSHDIVKGGVNRKNNQTFNDLKFFKFKQRLVYKASCLKNKIVKLVNEAYTSQGCSSCGNLYKIGSSKRYECVKCKGEFDRDTNSAKNIMMKGMLL
jgi:IS605 OrfB family transposase